MTAFKLLGNAALLCALCLPGYVADAGAQENTPQHFPVKPGKMIRDPQEALRVEDMTDAELRERLAEYEAGKRDDRDGYIILNQIIFKHSMKRDTDSSEVKRLKEMKRRLSGEHPEFSTMKDFRLSDRIRYQERQQRSKSLGPEGNSEWEPRDDVLLRLYWSGQHAMAQYQFRVVFFKVPDGATPDKDLRDNKPILKIGTESLDPLKVGNKNLWTFQHPVEVFASQDQSTLLICTKPTATNYLALSQEESRSLGRFRIPWADKKAKKKDFCGIVSIEGKIVYRFRFDQRRPDRLISPIALSEDGRYAAIYIGHEVEGEDGPSISKPREIWTWEYRRKLTKHPGPWKDGEPADAYKAFSEMRRRFQKKPR